MGPVLLLGVPPLLRDIAYVPEAPVDQPVVVVDAKSKLSEARGAIGGADGGEGAPGGGDMHEAVLRLWTC